MRVIYCKSQWKKNLRRPCRLLHLAVVDYIELFVREAFVLLLFLIDFGRNRGGNKSIALRTFCTLLPWDMLQYKAATKCILQFIRFTAEDTRRLTD